MASLAPCFGSHACAAPTKLTSTELQRQPLAAAIAVSRNGRASPRLSSRFLVYGGHSWISAFLGRSSRSAASYSPAPGLATGLARTSAVVESPPPQREFQKHVASLLSWVRGICMRWGIMCAAALVGAAVLLPGRFLGLAAASSRPAASARAGDAIKEPRKRSGYVAPKVASGRNVTRKGPAPATEGRVSRHSREGQQRKWVATAASHPRREGEGLGSGDEDAKMEKEGCEGEAGRALAEAMERRGQEPARISVPLRMVALQGTVPARWRKDFLQSQGSRARLSSEPRESHTDITEELGRAFAVAESSGAGDTSAAAAAATTSAQNPKDKKTKPTKVPAVSADVASIGDRWLKAAVAQRLISPIPNAETSDWFKRLPDEFKALVLRSSNGDPGPAQGRVYGAPYRMGCLMVAWRSDKLARAGIRPIQKWRDLWDPRLRGRVALTSGTRETLSVAQRSLGAPFNLRSLQDPQLPRGREALAEALRALSRQVLVQDASTYLKALQLGDAWVAVGWSSDILPFQKRNSFIATAIPRDGTILFADLWAVPATDRLAQNQKLRERLGGRVRGPSPLVHQWLDFCLQPAREAALLKDTFAAYSPLALAGDKAHSDACPAPEALALKGTKPPLDTAPPTREQADGGHSRPAEDMGPHSSVKFPPGSAFLDPMSPGLQEDYEWVIKASRASRTVSDGPWLANNIILAWQRWWISKNLLWSS